MTAGMADIIAAHWLSEQNDRIGDPGWSCGCDASGTTSTFVDGHAAHVAEELAKAGYGNVQEALVSAADEMEAERRTWCLDDSGRHWIARTLNDLRDRAAALTADPLAVALADPEGHALVKAIHDRKAASNGN